MDPAERVLAREELLAWAARRQGEGARLVLTNGVFDLLHLGHVRYLRQARALGDALIVAVNSDASTHQLKGPLRPIVGQAERAEVLAALTCVDAVTIFDEPTASALVTALRPAIYAKGGDYAGAGASASASATARTITADELAVLAASGPLPGSDLVGLFERLPEARAVAGYGGEVCLIPYLPGHSTSELIARIVASRAASEH